MSKLMTSAIVLGLLCAMNVSYAQKEIYETYDGYKNGAVVRYDYTDESLFQVNTKLGNVTDIQLRPGETVTYIAGGDTTRWLIDKAMVGNTQHVYIKPTVENISTNVIINTNLRSYRLNVTETGTYNPIISFNFHDEAKASYSPALENPQSVQGARNYNYKFKAKKKLPDASLMPKEIYDDGFKTYIRIDERNKYDMPVLYSIDPWDKKMSMVNYRVQGYWFVADKVMSKGRLLYHQKFWIDFENLEKTEGDKTVYQDGPSYRRYEEESSAPVEKYEEPVYEKPKYKELQYEEPKYEEPKEEEPVAEYKEASYEEPEYINEEKVEERNEEPSESFNDMMERFREESAEEPQAYVEETVTTYEEPAESNEEPEAYQPSYVPNNIRIPSDEYDRMTGKPVLEEEG